MGDPNVLQDAIEAVVRQHRLTELPTVNADSPLGRFDAEDRDLLVQGDLAWVHSLRGGRSLIVQGDVRGDRRGPMRLEFHGDILITGSVVHALLQGRRVRVGGAAAGTQIVATGEVAVGREVDGGRIIVGDYEHDRHRIESTRISLERTRSHCEAVTRRVASEEKRLDKSCRTLRIPLDFNVGRVVQHREGRVSVSLGPFYESLEGRTEEQFELALSQFFTRGIIGVITRRNRRYLVNFPAREKVFMQLVRSLRELFASALERDRLRRRAAWLEERVQHMVDDLEARTGTIEVGGTIAGTTAFEFILPRVVLKDDACEFVHQTARLDVSGADGAVVVVSYGADGERSTSTVLPSELAGQRFVVSDGRILWESAADTVDA